MKHILKTSILFALIGLITTSCNRDKLDDFITTQDYGVANGMMSDAKDMVDVNFNSSAEARLSAPACDGATITIENLDSFLTPDSLTIDFGNTNIWCHGKFRKGKIIAIRTAPQLTKGSITTITFEDYFVNDHQIDGEKIVTNTGLNTDHFLEFDIEAVIDIHLENGNSINWISNRTRTWISGGETLLDRSDDQYEINGSTNGTHINGDFNVIISSPIILDIGCWENGSCAIKSGVAEVTPPNGNTRVIDYGDGSCDCNRTITVNGTTYEVSF